MHVFGRTRLHCVTVESTFSANLCQLADSACQVKLINIKRKQVELLVHAQSKWKRRAVDLVSVINILTHFAVCDCTTQKQTQQNRRFHCVHASTCINILVGPEAMSTRH